MENPVIIFDGVCNLCNGLVNFIIKLDKKRIFRFSPSQSEFSQNILNNSDFKSNPINTIIVIENGRILVKSDAILVIAKYLGGFWKYFGYFNFVPSSIRNYFYDIIAENRYRFFGRREKCMIPDESIKERFLS